MVISEAIAVATPTYNCLSCVGCFLLAIACYIIIVSIPVAISEYIELAKRKKQFIQSTRPKRRGGRARVASLDYEDRLMVKDIMLLLAAVLSTFPRYPLVECITVIGERKVF